MRCYAESGWSCICQTTGFLPDDLLSLELRPGGHPLMYLGICLFPHALAPMMDPGRHSLGLVPLLVNLLPVGSMLGLCPDFDTLSCP